MATFNPITPLLMMVRADADTTVTIPGGLVAMGYQYLIVDNNGTAGSHNIALSGPISGTTSGTAISTAYGSALLTWDGATYHQFVGP